MSRAWLRAVIRTRRRLPSAELLEEIEYVDTSIGEIVDALKDCGHL